MTTILTAQGRDTIWLLADRRLSYSDGRPPRDGMKVLIFEGTNGVAQIGYAGLGATARGMEPSAWMSRVLRGRVGLTVDDALRVLADAATREIPRHILSIGGHFFLAHAFIESVGPRFYAIEFRLDDAHQMWYRFVHMTMDVPGRPCLRYGVAGTGGDYLDRLDPWNRLGGGGDDYRDRLEVWKRPLLRLLKANDHGKVSDIAVADYLAALNNQAHLGVRDGSVGPRSVVVWRRRPGVGASRGGGGFQFYDGTDRDQAHGYAGALPTISDGNDLKAMLDPFMEQALRRMNDPSLPFEDMLNFDMDEIGRQYAALPTEPDERLA